MPELSRLVPWLQLSDKPDKIMPEAEIAPALIKLRLDALPKPDDLTDRPGSNSDLLVLLFKSIRIKFYNYL